MAISREKEEILAQSVQSPHDTDSNYRNKDGNKVKGFSINVTESCDEDKGLKLICKNDITKWRIDTGKGYRYFTQKEVDTYLIRRKIAATPIETLQFRNNVEATIFQLGYHYSNAKSRYRGLIKHQMWANIRCLWINFVRILKYINQTCQRTTILARYALKSFTFELYSAFNKFVTAILPNHLSCSGIIQFSHG